MERKMSRHTAPAFANVRTEQAWGGNCSSCLSWALGSPLWAVSPSLCLSLIVGIRGMASLAWSSLSPELSTGGGSEQCERPGYHKGDEPRKRTLRVSASFGNNFPPSGG